MAVVHNLYTTAAAVRELQRQTYHNSARLAADWVRNLQIQSTLSRRLQYVIADGRRATSKASGSSRWSGRLGQGDQGEAILL